MTIIAATPEATAWYSAGRLETDRVAISRCTTSSGSRAGEGDGGGGIGFVGAGASRKAACRRYLLPPAQHPAAQEAPAAVKASEVSGVVVVAA